MHKAFEANIMMKPLGVCVSSFLIIVLIFSDAKVTAQEGPGIVIAHPGQDIELLCTVTLSGGQTAAWVINNGGPHMVQQLHNGKLTGYSTNGNNLIIENIMMNDDRNDTEYSCVTVPSTVSQPTFADIIDESDPTILYVAAIDQVTGVVLTCAPITLFDHQCTVMWNLITQGDITGYQVYYNGTMMSVNSSTTTLTFTAPSLPDGAFTGTVVVMVTAVNRYGVGPASNPESAVITVDSSVITAVATVISPNVTKSLYNITVTCTIHPNSTADHCVVMAIADNRVTRMGTAPIVNEMAAVIVNELECEVTYTTMVVGTLDGDLVGPRLSYETVTTGTCPVSIVVDDESDDELSTGAAVGITFVVTFIITLVVTTLITYIITSMYYKHKSVISEKGDSHALTEDNKRHDPAYATITAMNANSAYGAATTVKIKTNADPAYATTAH